MRKSDALKKQAMRLRERFEIRHGQRKLSEFTSLVFLAPKASEQGGNDEAQGVMQLEVVDALTQGPVATGKAKESENATASDGKADLDFLCDLRAITQYTLPGFLDLGLGQLESYDTVFHWENFSVLNRNQTSDSEMPASTSASPEENKVAQHNAHGAAPASSWPQTRPILWLLSLAAVAERPVRSPVEMKGQQVRQPPNRQPPDVVLGPQYAGAPDRARGHPWTKSSPSLDLPLRDTAKLSPFGELLFQMRDCWCVPCETRTPKENESAPTEEGRSSQSSFAPPARFTEESALSGTQKSMPDSAYLLLGENVVTGRTEKNSHGLLADFHAADFEIDPWCPESEDRLNRSSIDQAFLQHSNLHFKFFAGGSDPLSLPEPSPALVQAASDERVDAILRAQPGWTPAPGTEPHVYDSHSFVHPYDRLRGWRARRELEFLASSPSENLDLDRHVIMPLVFIVLQRRGVGSGGRLRGAGFLEYPDMQQYWKYELGTSVKRRVRRSSLLELLHFLTVTSCEIFDRSLVASKSSATDSVSPKAARRRERLSEADALERVLLRCILALQVLFPLGVRIPGMHANPHEPHAVAEFVQAVWTESEAYPCAATLPDHPTGPFPASLARSSGSKPPEKIPCRDAFFQSDAAIKITLPFREALLRALRAAAVLTAVCHSKSVCLPTNLRNTSLETALFGPGGIPASTLKTKAEDDVLPAKAVPVLADSDSSGAISDLVRRVTAALVDSGRSHKDGKPEAGAVLLRRCHRLSIFAACWSAELYKWKVYSQTFAFRRLKNAFFSLLNANV